MNDNWIHDSFSLEYTVRLKIAELEVKSKNE